ncbi:MAG: TonB-dependent receptor [Cyclobacteriaceae bacterium]|nr:TonB-dependent receptor [Cyclobacteriaceae bacterium]
MTTRIILCIAAFTTIMMYGNAGFTQNKFTVSGYVSDAENGEELIGVSVLVKELGTGAISNMYGFYSISLSPGKYQLALSYIGYETVEREIDLTKQNLVLNFSLKIQTMGLQEVIVTGRPDDHNLTEISMSRVELNLDQVKKLPALFGESDIIKAIQMQPGVITAGEGTSGYFVRGGSSDQNLILIDEAPVYDASHLFGLFSVFNSDVIKSSELYKGGIPAQYGGRLSSMLDVRTRDGNNKRFAATGGIGSLASRIALEGPLKRDESSFLISARRSYLDVFQRMSSHEDVNSNLVHFYDVNAKLNWRKNNNNRFFVAGYFGRDVFRFGNDAAFGWGNSTLTFRWNHLYNERLFSNLTLVGSNFDYSLELFDPGIGFQWTANMQDLQLKLDYTWYPNPDHIVSFGYNGSYKRFVPGNISPNDPSSIFKAWSLEKMYAFEHAFYLGDEHRISSRLSMQYGLRLSAFQNVGSTLIRDYLREGETGQIEYEPVYYGKFEPIKTFINLEPRFNARYMLSDRTSLKTSYNRMTQNVHLISNSTVPIPFNTWQPSSPYLNTQVSDQIAAGVFRNLANNSLEFSAEAYYKWMQGVPDFADGADIFFNPDLALDFRPGDVEAYGLELHAVKTKGKLTGSVAYTWSKAIRTTPDVNEDRPYYANFDRRHVFNSYATYDLNDAWSFGAAFTYSTGRPITLPVGKYNFDGYLVDVVSERNGYRLPDFHRLDLSATWKPAKNKSRKWEGSWVFSVYNAYNRKNPFTIHSRSVNDDNGHRNELRMIYLFPVLPSVTYNFNF